ncbi:quinon protein alcohol dehydrogenase-like superfamily [Chiua virens]|nr:quinon protein alcohol dehydrogenase-like superfamily [Chiua virens]
MKTSERINAVVVSPDGRWIVSGGSSKKVTIWSTVTQKGVIEVAEHTKTICALDVSSDSLRFASGAGDKTARIFDITSGIRLIPPLQHPNTVVGVKFSPDGCRIATATHTSPFVGVYDARSGEQLFEISVAASWTPITPLSWSTDSQLLFAASPGEITYLDTSTSSCSEWPIHDNNK